MNEAALVVRGSASAEELAAVLAALCAPHRASTREDRYATWRRGRIAALRLQAREAVCTTAPAARADRAVQRVVAGVGFEPT